MRVYESYATYRIAIVMDDTKPHHEHVALAGRAAKLIRERFVGSDVSSNFKIIMSGNGECSITLEVLGADPDEVIEYLESQE